MARKIQKLFLLHTRVAVADLKFLEEVEGIRIMEWGEDEYGWRELNFQ